MTFNVILKIESNFQSWKKENLKMCLVISHSMDEKKTRDIFYI